MPKRILQGVVISDKQQKTLVVKVERRFTHPLLKKTVRKSKNYHAHVENKTQKVGDTVSIEETKPISKLKRWIVIDEAEGEAAKAKPGGESATADERNGRQRTAERRATRQIRRRFASVGRGLEASSLRRPSGKEGC